MLTKLKELIELVGQLRHPQKGDPWILAQNFKSLTSHTIEEVYEFADSVDQNNYDAICDELGDLLLHIILYATLASELNQFNLADIAQSAIAKQKRRKLHYPKPDEITEIEALKQWELNKKKERSNTAAYTSALDGIAHSLPSINRALKIQSRAAQVGFDWLDVTPVFEKVTEEISEIKEALTLENNTVQLTEEVGDLLFTCINLARKCNINPDTALRHANNKFDSRFRLIEEKLKDEGRKPENCSLKELDRMWEQIKKRLT